MKALILAAGRGTRVRPFTRRTPKPMLPILGTPVMETLVGQLRDAGVDDIVVNTSYLSEHIENYFRDGRNHGVRMAYSFEGRMEDGSLVDEPVGSAGAIRRIQEHSGFFDEPFVVLCGDALIDLDLKSAAQSHVRRKAMASLVLKEVEEQEVSNYGVAVTDDEGRIIAFQEKPAVVEAQSRLANTGIYFFDPSVIERIPADTVYDIGSQLLPDLVEAGLPVYGEAMAGSWLDIGQLPDYFRVTQQALRGEVPGIVRPGRSIAYNVFAGANTRVEPAATISGPVCIGGSTIIESGATIVGPTWIGAGCVIESGATITRGVILDHTRIGGTADVTDMVINGEHCVAADGTVVSLDGAAIDWAVSDARVPAAVGRQSRRQFLDTFIRAEQIYTSAY